MISLSYFVKQLVRTMFSFFFSSSIIRSTSSSSPHVNNIN